MNFYSIIPPLLFLILIVSSIVTVRQGTVAVITVFGKYRRVIGPGLNFKFLKEFRSKIEVLNWVFRQ